MDGISKQRDAVREIKDHNLKECCGEQPEERPLDSPQPPLSGGNGSVYCAVRMPVRSPSMVMSMCMTMILFTAPTCTFVMRVVVSM